MNNDLDTDKNLCHDLILLRDLSLRKREDNLRSLQAAQTLEMYRADPSSLISISDDLYECINMAIEAELNVIAIRLIMLFEKLQNRINTEYTHAW